MSAVPNGPGFSLFDRASRLTVGNVEIENIGRQVGLSVWFNVKQSLKGKTPNTATVKIWNLSNTTLKGLAQSAQPVPGVAAAPGAPSTVTPVKIEAGYVDHMPQIFLGEMRAAQTVRDKTDFVTELTTGDGDQANQLRANVHLDPGTNAYNAALTLLRIMKLGNGNIAAVQSILQGATLYNQGATLKGNAQAILTDMCRSVGLEFSCQNGQAQFMANGRPLSGQAYEIGPNTGMIGEPSVDTKGVLSVMTLLLPGLKPGSPIEMNSRFVKGTYRIISMDTTGDTSGTDWYHKIEAKAWGLAP